MFFEVPKTGDIWRKFRSHVGTTVKHSFSPATAKIKSRLSDDGVKKTESICPYCAVGCSTLVYYRGGRIIDIEGNPDSPINAGTLCPKGFATFGLHVSPHRWTKVKYRRPYSAEWEDLDIGTDGNPLRRAAQLNNFGEAARVSHMYRHDPFTEAG